MSAPCWGRSTSIRPKAAWTARAIPTPSTATTNSSTPAIINHLILTQKNGVPIHLSSLGNVDRRRGEHPLRPVGPEPSRPCWSSSSSRPTPTSSKPWTASEASCRKSKNGFRQPSKSRSISDRTTTIRASVNDVQILAHLSIALVVMVIFLFLRRFWPTFIASVTVPLALAGTFGVDVSAATTASIIFR